MKPLDTPPLAGGGGGGGTGRTSPKLATTIKTWLPEARVQAAQCWCDKTTSGKEMDVALAEVIARKIAVWMNTAAQYARDAEYWRERALEAKANAKVSGPTTKGETK